MPNHQFAVRIKPGERSMIGGTSYVALIPHSILEGNLHKNMFLVEYPEKEVLKKEWVSIKDLEERGVIKLINEATEEYSKAFLRQAESFKALSKLIRRGDPTTKQLITAAITQGLAEVCEGLAKLEGEG